MPVSAHLSFFRVLTSQMAPRPHRLFRAFPTQKRLYNHLGTGCTETKHIMDLLDQEPKSPGHLVQVLSSNGTRWWYPRKFRSTFVGCAYCGRLSCLWVKCPFRAHLSIYICCFRRVQSTCKIRRNYDGVSLQSKTWPKTKQHNRHPSRGSTALK